MGDSGDYLNHSFIVKLVRGEQVSLYYFTGKTAARRHAGKLYKAYQCGIARNTGVSLWEGNEQDDPDGLNWKQLGF
jgi:hypothetical protein